MRDQSNDPDLPSYMHTVNEKGRFIAKLVSNVREKNWTLDDVNLYLTEKGFRKDTKQTIYDAVKARLQTNHVETGEYPTDDKGNHIRDDMMPIQALKAKKFTTSELTRRKKLPLPTQEEIDATTLPDYDDHTTTKIDIE